MTIGSVTTELSFSNETYKESLEESLKCITIVVPKSTKNKYSFKTVHQIEWDQHDMDRRFRIIENDEDC